jgi:hypothetical protein
MSDNSWLNRAMCGAISGILEVTATQPLDLLKTQIQNEKLKHPTKSINFLSQSSSIYRSGGFMGFYRGYVPRIFGIIPMRVSYWGTMSHMNDIFHEKTTKYKKVIITGAICGFVQTLVDNPVEVIKTKMITNDKINFKDAIKLLRPHGFTAHLVRNVQFATCVNLMMSFKTDNNFYNFWLCAVGGLLGSITSQPWDVMKTEKQRYTTGLQKTYIEMCRAGVKNPKLLWSGGLMRASQGFINMGIGGVTFMILMDLFKE